MTKKTEFFTQLAPLIGNVPVDIRITAGKSGTVVCDFLPGGRHEDNDLKPLRLTGTAEELNQGFFGNVEEAMRIVESKGLSTSLAEFAQSAEEEADLTVKPTKPAKKTEKKKDDKSKNSQTGHEIAEEEESILRKKYTKSGTKVLEAKLNQSELPGLDINIIQEILATRTDRTPVIPKHPEEVITELKRIIQVKLKRAQNEIKICDLSLESETDIEEVAHLNEEKEKADKCVITCDDCLKRMEEGTYGIASDNTLIAKEALLSNPLKY